MPTVIYPETGEPLRIPIKMCDVCGKPIVRMRRVPAGHGKIKMIWSQRMYCGERCKKRAQRVRAAMEKHGIRSIK